MNESQRLKYLHGLEILDTDQEEIYDDIVATVASIFDCPIALVSLIDETRQWFKARYGLEVEQTPREYSFCSHAIEDNKLLVVIDAREDQRFKDNPLVTGDPHIVSYAGAPLIAPNGLKLGTLCVIDRRPREFTEELLANLARLSRIVTKHLDKRYQERLLMKSQLFSAHVEKSSKTGGWEVDLVTDVMPADNININYGHISVVVVDDEQLIGEVLGELLSEFTTNINTFTDPHEALKYIRQNNDKVDLVLSDIKMPKLDGIELLSQTQDLRGIVFYFISGGMNLSYQQRLKKLDFEGFIDKPFKPEDMSQIFKKHFKPL